MNNNFNNTSHRTWAEINLNNVEHNYHEIKNHIQSKICCVVKANAYGHSAIMLSALYQKLGADYLAVSNIEEALQLRNNNITIPILILGYTPPECASLLSEYKLSQTVYSIDYGRKLTEHASRCGCQISVHIKIDSGMGRIGFKPNKESVHDIISLFKGQNLLAKGIFTHFAVADEGKNGCEYTILQYESFKKSIKYLQEQGLNFDIVHCSNSAAILDYSDFEFNMVRAGIILYGLYPSGAVKQKLNLIKAMRLVSVISHIKYVEPGESVSYGRTFVAQQRMKIATVPVGYADGFWRSNGNGRYSLKVNGQYAKIIGRICMDQLMLDVTDIECDIGDEVLIFGDDERCSADIIAKLNNTINYEVVCSVRERVPRVFIKDNNIAGLCSTMYGITNI